MTFEEVVPDPVMCFNEHLENIKLTLALANLIEAKYGKPLHANSGYRSMRDHCRIYREINEKRRLQKLKPVPIPMRSQHLFGRAIDIADPLGELKIWWVAQKPDLAEELNIWCESFKYTKEWIHIQTVPPASKTRYFRPF